MERANRRIILMRDIHGDFPFQHVCAPAGVHDAYMNPYGAVSVIATNGEMLGIKPNEFEWLDDHS